MSEAEKFLTYVRSPQKLGRDEQLHLEELCEKYPYFHLSKMLLLKSLANQESFRLPSLLSSLSGLVAERDALYRLLNPQNPVDAFSGIFIPTSESANTASQIPVSNKETEKFPRDKNEELIERFIRTNPKISPIEKREWNQTPTDFSEESVTEHENLMTETLARIYFEQKKYDKALTAYRILSLKYPKKSSFFANRIQQIESLMRKEEETSSRKKT